MVRKEESPCSVDQWEKAAVLIAQEIRQWSAEILEQRSAAYGNMPPCPYARAAWLEQRVMVHVTADLSSVVDIKACFPPTEDMIHVIAWTDWDQMSPDEFTHWLSTQNQNHFGVWLMGFHPEADEDETFPTFEGNGADDYAIILVQSLAHLVEASDQLRNTPYYDQMPADDMAFINQRKETFDAWDKKVDAKAFAEQEEWLLAQRVQGQEVDH